MQLLAQEKVALEPGNTLGAPATVRVSYATSEELITGAIAGLHTFLTSL